MAQGILVSGQRKAMNPRSERTARMKKHAVVLVLGSLNYHDLREALEEVGDESGVDAENIPYTG